MTLWKRTHDSGSDDTDGQVSPGRPPAEDAGVPLTAETTDLTPSEGDERLLADALDTLAEAGFHPRVEVGTADIAEDSSCGVSRFRRHPLVSLLALRDLDEEQVFERVFHDLSAEPRTTPESLVALVEQYAAAAGTAGRVGDVTVVMDPDSRTSGSFRFTNGDRVNDISFDLDPDFGDEDAEMQIAFDVSPDGHRPRVVFAGDTARPVILWAPENADLSALDEVQSEGV